MSPTFRSQLFSGLLMVVSVLLLVSLGGLIAWLLFQSRAEEKPTTYPFKRMPPQRQTEPNFRTPASNTRFEGQPAPVQSTPTIQPVPRSVVDVPGMSTGLGPNLVTQPRYSPEEQVRIQDIIQSMQPVPMETHPQKPTTWTDSVLSDIE